VIVVTGRDTVIWNWAYTSAAFIAGSFTYVSHRLTKLQNTVQYGSCMFLFISRYSMRFGTF
jgi:hypothetical protein